MDIKERLAREICSACDQDPDAQGTYANHHSQWQSYDDEADAAIMVFNEFAEEIINNIPQLCDGIKKLGCRIDGSLHSHDSHYTSKSIQPWDAMKAWMSDEQFEGFLRGSIIKYIARYKDKGGVDDLRKARVYLDRLIEVVNGK